MIDSQETVALLSDPELLARTRELVDKSHCTEAELLAHLGEIDERKLFLERAFPSMFAYCVGDLRFSEDAAYCRITVARAGRRYAAVIEALRSGQVHLTGLKLLAPHLTADNHRERARSPRLSTRPGPGRSASTAAVGELDLRGPPTSSKSASREPALPPIGPP